MDHLFFRFNQNIETLCFGIEAKQPKQTVLKETKKKRNNLNRPKKTEKPTKIAKYAPYQTVLVGLLFVLVQSKHRNSLFWYRSETAETSVLFQIVPVPVSVVSNRN